jgi:hypothetical protein
MKKLLLVAAVLFTAGLAKAEPLAFDIGGTTLVLPLQIVNATQMYSFEEERGFTGAETVLVTRGDFDLTLGAATGYGSGIQFPFIGGQFKLPETFFDTSNNELKFGAWLGRDFDAKDSKWGIKASIQLW